MRRTPACGLRVAELYKHNPAAAKVEVPNVESKEGKIIINFLLELF